MFSKQASLPRPTAATARRGAWLAVTVLAVAAMGACQRPPTTGGPGPTTTATTAAPGSSTTSTTQRPPSGGGTTTVTATIKVTRDFDGRGGTWKGGGSLGSGGDGEGKKAIFEVSPGVTISNLTIGVPGADGIHCLGSCTIRNVVWQDVLDDAATLLGSSPNDRMVIDGGSAHKASDKVFQHNGPGTVEIKNFTVESFGKLYRSCGNCSKQFTRHVIISNVIAIGPGKDLAGINSNYNDTADISNVTIRNDSGHKIVPCQTFTGNSSGSEPSTNSSGRGCTVKGVTWQ
jgi:hypothetical protein